MTQSCCPDHGELMRELALGRLGDEDGVRAEELRHSCQSCRRWWDQHYGESTVMVLDAAVAAAFAEFVPHRQRRKLHWPAAAAAAALVAAIAGSVFFGHRGSSPEIARQPSERSEAVVSLWDFEDGGVAARAAAAEPATVSQVQAAGDGSVMTADFESGDLAVWSSHG